MTQKKLPLRPLPDGITLPEVPEGWEWCSTDVQDIVLYMPGGDDEQFVIWANFYADFEPIVSMAPPQASHPTFCMKTADGDIAVILKTTNLQEAIDLLATRVMLGGADYSELP